MSSSMMKNGLNRGYLRDKGLINGTYCVLGDNGDCGNFAIAFRRVVGGRLHGIWNDRGFLDHVMVVYRGFFHDSNKIIPTENMWDAITEMWDQEPKEIKPVSQEHVFEVLSKTNHARIKVLESWLRNGGFEELHGGPVTMYMEEAWYLRNWKKYNKTCPACGTVFNVKFRWGDKGGAPAKYCSKECKEEAKNVHGSKNMRA